MNTYNFYYETSGFERTVNGYSSSEVSKAELQFKTSRKAVKKGLPIEDFKTEFTTLSTILHTQANHLDGIEAEGVCGLTFGEAEAAPVGSIIRGMHGSFRTEYNIAESNYLACC